jgi:pimeloyl-ACP methyl ester carboxylesterase
VCRAEGPAVADGDYRCNVPTPGRDDDMLTVEVQSIPVSYVTYGEGTPVVLIHGWSADHRYMVADLEPVFRRQPGWKRIYLDLPGHGQTPAPPWMTSQDQMLAVIGDFIDTLLADQAFALVGSSYGGHTALGMLRTMPGRVLGACLIVPDLPAADGSRLPEPATVVYPEPDALGGLAAGELWMLKGLVAPERWMVDELREHDMPAYRQADYAFLERLNERYLASGAAGHPGLPFPRPSLVLTGRQDATTGFRSAWDLVDELPRATLAVLDLAGHQLGRIERPAPFNVLVADWLDRMEQDRRHSPPPHRRRDESVDQ